MPEANELSTTELQDREASNLEVDWFLREIVEFANSGAPFPMSLIVGGTTFEGMVVGGREYFDTIARLVTPSTDGPEAAAGIRFLQDRWRNLGETAYSDENLATSPPFYIHLIATKARVGAMTSNYNPPTPIRFRLSAISGFHLGTSKE